MLDFGLLAGLDDGRAADVCLHEYMEEPRHEGGCDRLQIGMVPLR